MAVPLTVASFLLLIAVSAATSIALSWRCCGDLHWEVRKWKRLDQGAIIPSSITATIPPISSLASWILNCLIEISVAPDHPRLRMKAFVYIFIELSAFDPTVIISSGLITFIHSCHVFVVGSDSKGAAYFLSTAISLSSGHRCDALGITVGVHDHDDLSAMHLHRLSRIAWLVTHL